MAIRNTTLNMSIQISNIPLQCTCTCAYDLWVMSCNSGFYTWSILWIPCNMFWSIENEQNWLLNWKIQLRQVMWWFKSQTIKVCIHVVFQNRNVEAAWVFVLGFVRSYPSNFIIHLLIVLCTLSWDRETLGTLWSSACWDCMVVRVLLIALKLYMLLSSESQKKHVLAQLQSGNYTWKVVALVGMTQSWVAHMRKEIVGEVEKQRGGCPRHL